MRYNKDMNNEKVFPTTLAEMQPFFRNLADAYKVQWDAQKNLLNEQRRQQQTGIMSQANQAGMLYSNFPQRAQIQYDTNTYMPAMTKLSNTYFTGLNDLRNKGTQLANSIRTTEQAIADMNEDIQPS